jgi:hypothetical protein
MSHKSQGVRVKPKKMTRKAKDEFESIVQNAVNSDLEWMLSVVLHEVELSDLCIHDGEEKKR